jgi:ubiquinol-cytochrome c reductase cytochrome c subunit
MKAGMTDALRVLGRCLPLVGTAVLVSLVVPAVHAGRSHAATEPIDAATVYLQNCASCHGGAATGTNRGPTLQGVGTAAVDFYLSTGRMPKRDVSPKPAPYKPAFSPAVITALDQYVTMLAAHGGPAIPSVDPRSGDTAQGGELYRDNCAACHGWGGTGGELTARPLPSITEATPTQLGEAVRIGPSQMPAFGTSSLSAQQVDSIAAYVNYLKHPDDRGGLALAHLGPVPEGAVAALVGLLFLLGVIRWIGKRG